MAAASVTYLAARGCVRDTFRRVGPSGGGSFDVCPGAGSARGGHAYLVVARLYTAAVPRACSHSAECILPVVVHAAAAAAKLLAGHGMIDVAALHVLTTVTRRGWDAGVGACGSQAKLTTASASDRWREGDTGTVSR